MLSESDFVIAARRLLHEKNFDEAAAIFRANDAIPLSGPALLYKSIAIQLAADAASYSLDDARECLLLAVEQDEDYAAGWVELGHFYYGVDDTPQLALECFERAAKIANTLRVEAILGQAKALRDMGRDAEAIGVLDFAGSDSLQKIVDLRREIQCGN